MFQKILLLVGDYLDNEKAALMAVRLAKYGKASVTALSINRPESGNMLGDEWISDQHALDRFFSYMRDRKEREDRKLLDEAAAKARELGLMFNMLRETGEPATVLFSVFKRHGPFDLLVLPAGCISGGIGLDVKNILRKLSCPVLVVPEEKDKS